MNKEKAFKETLDKKLKLLEKLNNQDIPLQNKLINFSSIATGGS